MVTSTFSIPGCALWLDAADPSTIVGTTHVSEWRDKSGNGRNATATGTTITRSTLNGLTAINYSGSSYLTAPVTSGAADPFTIFAVFNATYPINGPVYTTSTTKDGNGFFFNLAAGSDANSYSDYLARGNTENSFITKNPSTFRGNTTYIISIVSTSVNGGTITLFRDGTSYMSGTTGGNFTWTSFLIGKRNIPSVPYTDQFAGKFGEFIIFNSALATTQRQQVERYLLDKWSILVPLSIPGCALWLDAADSTTITGTTTSVSEWRDKSGNGYNAVPHLGTISQTTLNGLNALNFGTTGVMKANNFLWQSSFTQFFVGYVTGQQGIIIDTQNSGGTYGMYVYTGNGTLLNIVNSTLTAGLLQVNDSVNPNGTPVPPTNQWFIFSIGYGSAGTAAMNYTLNGTVRSTTVYPATPPFTGGSVTHSPLTLYINGVVGGTLAPGGARIAEVIHFNSVLTPSQRQRVEIYLSQKWNIPLSYSIPTSIPGCVLWLDAADSSTLTGTTTVSEWRDKSGNGNTLSQTTSSQQPTIVANVVGALPVVRFTGTSTSSTSLRRSTFTSLGTQGITFILVERNMTDPGQAGAAPFSFAQSGSPNGGIVYQNNGGLQPFAGIAFNSSTPRIHIYYRPNTSGSGPATGYENGTSVVIEDTTTGTYSTTFAVGLRLAASLPMSGDICEIIFFNTALTTSQRQQIEGYLSQKWNIPLSYYIPLPSSVPVFSLPIIKSNTTTNQPSVFFPKGSQMISTLTSRLGAPTIPGCVLWLDAADASTITGTTSVTAWRDKSGSGNNMTITGGTVTYSANPPAVVFPNAQVSCRSALSTNVITAGSSSIFMVVQNTAMSTNNGINMAFTTVNILSGTAAVSLRFQEGINKLRVSANEDIGSSYFVNGTLGIPGGAGLNLITVPDGYNIIDTTFNVGGTTQFALSVPIGNSLAARYFIGNIQEVIVFTTAITTSQRQQVEGYLATKWGLRANLDPTHPYSSVPYTGPFTLNPTTPVSKSFVAVYQCPTVASAMNIGIGSNMDSSAFGLCQSNSVLYSPYQYVVGDISFSVPSYTGMNYAFASFNVSTNSITGVPGFNDLSTAAVAFQNKAVNTPFYIGSSTTLYTSSGFHLCEFIATSNALSSTDRQSVEGYLASKWGLLDQLPFSHPYKNFQPSGDQWIPPTLPTTILGLVSWLDITYPGQTTASIADRVGGSFTVNVGSGNQFQLSNINNLPSLYFPGNSSNYLSKPSLPSSAEGSVLFVFNISDTRSDLPILTWGASTGTAPWGPLLTYTAGTTLKLQNNYAGATGSDTTPLTLAMTSGTNLVFFAWDYSNFYLSVNGGIPVIGSNAIPGSAERIYIGGNVTGSVFPRMNFGELVVYNQYFEKSERQLLEGYLAWKWALQGTLPPNHPFSKISPTGATVLDTDALNTPAQIASLTTWLDAADSDTILQSSGKVTTWYDKSATSDVFLGTTTTAPTYSTTNGPYLPGVYFSGQNALRGTVSAAIASGVGTCFMLATISGNGQVFTGDYVSSTTPAVGKSFGLMCVNKDVTCPLQSDARVNRNPLPGVLSTTTSILYSQMNAAITPKIGVGSYGFGTPTNVVSTVNGQSVSWQPSVPSSSPWNLGYIGTNPALQDFYLHEFLCFSEYFTESQRFVVEGYLAWKWRIQSQLPLGHPYKNVRPVDAPFSPNLVAGIALWLDAADSSTITGTTSVTNVADKSGSNVILSSATGFSWPNNRFNGRYPSFYNPISTQGGTGANYTLGINSSFSKPTPFTVFFVGQYTSDVVPGYIMDSTSAGTGRPYTYQANISTPFGSLGTAKVLTSPSVVSMNWIAGTSTSQVYVNGELKYGGTLTAFTTSGITVGNRYSLNESFPGHICEFIWFNGTLSGYQRQQIEGYLAWKWGLQSSLPSTHLFKNAIPTRSTNFMPTSVPGIALWLDAADASTIVGTASLVNEWKDKSGNGLNATKNTDVAPTYSSTGFNNGLPGVLFNGSTTKLHTPSISPRPVLSSNGTDTTIFAVMNWVGGVNANLLGLDTTTNMFCLFLPWTRPTGGGRNMFVDLGNDTLGRFGQDNELYYTDSTPLIFSITRSGANGSIFINGNIHASSTTLGGTIGTTTQTLGIGCSVANGGVFNSYIAEILIYNRALTTAERQQVEGYLAWKWRRQSTLGTTHPYSKFGP
jgi:hypothetical protein